MEHEPTTGDEEWQRAQRERAAFPWFGAAPSPTGESATADQPALPIPDQTTVDTGALGHLAANPEAERLPGDIASDTGGELVPRYELIQRRADRLAVGDLTREPHLREIRIIWVTDAGYDAARQVGLVELYWIDDTGFNAAARTLPANERVTLRVAGVRDAASIQRGIDRSRYYHTLLDHHSARLIAAHLQGGPASPLYRLAVTGEIPPTALEELQWLASSGRRVIRRWSAALRGYCEGRTDSGPLPGFEDRPW